MAEDTAKAAGRGGLAIAVAKITFVLLGLAQQVIFPLVLDDAGYGAVSRMLSIVSVVNNVIVATSLQGVSRMVAGAKPGAEQVAFRNTLRLHVLLALVVSTVFALLAGSIANWIEAPHAANPLRVAAGVVLCYGVYAPLVGALNGQRKFFDQAGLDIFYGVSRTAAMTIGAWAFARVLGLNAALGAAVGFVAAAALIVPVAISRAGLGRSGEGGPSARDYLKFLGPLIVAQAGLNLLLQTDMILLSEAAGEHARLAGLDVEEADKLLASYRATQLFGFLPFQLLMSVQFVLFPLLSKAHSEQDHGEVKALTEKGMRLAFVLTGLFAGVLAGLGPLALRMVYRDSIAEGGFPIIRMYVLGLAGLAILGVASAALASLRRERHSVAVTWTAVVTIAAIIWLTQPKNEFGAALLFATARATAIGMVTAAVLAAVLLRRAAGVFAPTATLVRVALATAATVGAGMMMPFVHKLVVPLEAALLGVVYVGVLVATRELGKDDLGLVLRVLGRGKKAPT